MLKERLFGPQEDSTQEGLASTACALNLLMNLTVERACSNPREPKQIGARKTMRKAFESAGLLDILAKLALEVQITVTIPFCR